MIVLGIESSCDETSASIVKDYEMLSNIVYSQEIHAEYGGVVPELASREHQKNIAYVVKRALEKSHIKKNEIDVIAVTYGAGLKGALLVGLNFAKGMSMALNIPFVGVNHLEGHLFSNIMENTQISFPFYSQRKTQIGRFLFPTKHRKVSRPTKKYPFFWARPERKTKTKKEKGNISGNDLFSPSQRKTTNKIFFLRNLLQRSIISRILPT